MKDYLVLLIVVIFPFVIAITGKKARSKKVDRIKFYSSDIIYSFTFLLIMYFINNNLYKPLNFDLIGKGIIIAPDILSAILIVFIAPLISSFTRWQTFFSKGISKSTTVLGYPIQFLPNTTSEFILFVIYILFGVVFEELLSRQFTFYAFSSTFGLQGDVVLVISSILFALPHLYQGYKGVIITLIYGLLLGKFFQATETILVPITLHLCLNLTICVLALKRLRYIKEAENNSSYDCNKINDSEQQVFNKTTQ